MSESITGHKKRILIVTHRGFPEEQVQEIQEMVPAAECVTATDDTVLDRAQNIDALIGCPRFVFKDELLERAGSRLTWIHATGAGIEEFLIPKFIQSDITFTNGKIIQGPEVADHALALLLSFTRNLHLILGNRLEGPMPRPQELRGKTAVVVGVGGIGLLIAERCKAFGMKVIGVNPEWLPMMQCIDEIVPPDHLHRVLPQADAVLVAAPVTEMTTKMFGAQEFALMKPSSLFIVVSRGKTYDTDAIVTALQDNQIAGAGLDVTDPEPLPEDHALRKMSNVVLTPHIAGWSDHNRQRSFELVKTNVFRFVNDLPLLNHVNKQLGY